jgi:biopolymer transport protein ExbD
MNLRKRHKSASAEIHTSAMNDIMFFLLLFFLIASTITNPAVIKLALPKSKTGETVTKKTLNISVTKDLKYYVDQKQVEPDNLMQVIQSYKTPNTDLSIALFADKEVTLQNLVVVMDVANKLNMKLVLATEPK